MSHPLRTQRAPIRAALAIDLLVEKCSTAKGFETTTGWEAEALPVAVNADPEAPE